MRPRFSIIPLTALLVLGLVPQLAAGEKNPVQPAVELSKWEFKLAAPVWLAGTEGESGVRGRATEFDLDGGDILRRVDMTGALRAEASSGRFGILGEFLYLSLSDGVGVNNRAIRKVDLQLDQIMGDMALRWRLVEGQRGWVDLIGGVRYTSLYQQAVFQPNEERIEALSGRLARAGAVVRARMLRQALGSGGYRRQLPSAPLDADQHARLLAAVGKVKGNAAERKQSISKALRKAFSSRLNHQDDWWDPYVGLRARYNLPHHLYVTAKGEVGGFGVGSDLSCQASGALGWQFATHAYAELGYRALGIDYQDDGFTYDVVTHGAELTLGLQF